MSLYRKLAYVGSILGFLKYGSTFGIIVITSYFLPESRQLAVLIGSSSEMSFLMSLSLWSGVIGIVVSAVIIITIKKVSPMKKRLPITLLLMGVVFFILSGIAFSFISQIVDNTVATSSTNLWSAIAIAGHDVEQVYKGMNQQFLVEIIPAILLFVSGTLAFREYRKTA